MFFTPYYLQSGNIAIIETTKLPTPRIDTEPTNATAPQKNEGPEKYKEHITDEGGLNCLIPEEKILNTFSNNELFKLYDR